MFTFSISRSVLQSVLWHLYSYAERVVGVGKKRLTKSFPRNDTITFQTDLNANLEILQDFKISKGEKLVQMH